MQLRRFALKYLFLLILSPFLFSACSTDLDPNADYKEIMIIYSILNQNDKVHIAKVNKAFLNTRSNAITIAATSPDSITYAEDVLEVKMERLTVKDRDTLVLNSYPMERFISTSKEPGEFSSPNQVLYRTKPGEPDSLYENSLYRIVATNTKSGLKAYGTTELLKLNETTLSKRFSVFQVSFTRSSNPQLDKIDTSRYEPEKPNRVIFRGPENAFIYAVKLTFHYTETDGTNTQNKQLSFYLRNNFLPTSTDVDFAVDNRFFYTNLLNMIDTSKDTPNTKRSAGNIIVTVTAGSESLAINHRINNSFSIFSQVKPEWDNISNGTGLIGSRVQREVKTRLSPQALAELVNNPEYQKLKF